MTKIRDIALGGLGIFTLLLLMGTCVTGDSVGRVESALEGAAGTAQAATSTAMAAARTALRPLPPDRLDGPLFRNLPTEAMAYLKLLSEAFRNKDRDFLISQGEVQYDSELRNRLEEGVYLALLYRMGPYSEDSAWTPALSPLLDPAKVRGIEYTGWEEVGPMIKISARLHLEDGDPTPCTIMLIWRLVEPKILGQWP